MGFLDTLKGWLRSEGAELKDSAAGLRTRVDDHLTRRTRRLEETPAEAMARLQDEIDSSGSFDTVHDRIAGARAHADAVSDLTGHDTGDPGSTAPPTSGGTADDVLDLDSEEVALDADGNPIDDRT
ncbi:MAG: hypothetical protein ACFCVK_12535 [Acidimicrobiales bacterium]